MPQAVKMGLGTAQFGLDYGISNKSGQTPPEEVRRILAQAATRGVRTLDTACLYGESEAALGKAQVQDYAFEIVTKTPKFPNGFGAEDARTLETTFRESLAKLGLDSVYGLLAHQADDLLGPDGDRMMDILLALKARGLVAKVGASIYTGAQIDSLLARYKPDIVQIPFNVLDQNLLRGGQLRSLKAAGVEVHARSVFLQGLLLMDTSALPEYFDPVRPLLDRFRDIARAEGNSPLQAAIGFVAGREEIDRFLVGVNDLAQLLEIMDAEAGLRPAGDYSECHCGDERFVNPSLWKTK